MKSTLLALFVLMFAGFAGGQNAQIGQTRPSDQQVRATADSISQIIKPAHCDASWWGMTDCRAFSPSRHALVPFSSVVLMDTSSRRIPRTSNSSPQRADHSEATFGVRE